MIDVAALRAADEEVDWDAAAKDVLDSGRAWVEETRTHPVLPEREPGVWGDPDDPDLLPTLLLTFAAVFSVFGAVSGIQPGAGLEFAIIVGMLWLSGTASALHLVRQKRAAQAALAAHPPLVLQAPAPVRYELSVAPADAHGVLATVTRTHHNAEPQTFSVQLDGDTACASEQFAALSHTVLQLEEDARQRWQTAMRDHGLDEDTVAGTAQRVVDETLRALAQRTEEHAFAQTLSAIHAADRRRLTL